MAQQHLHHKLCGVAVALSRMSDGLIKSSIMACWPRCASHLRVADLPTGGIRNIPPPGNTIVVLPFAPAVGVPTAVIACSRCNEQSGLLTSFGGTRR